MDTSDSAGPSHDAHEVVPHQKHKSKKRKHEEQDDNRFDKVSSHKKQKRADDAVPGAGSLQIPSESHRQQLWAQKLLQILWQEIVLKDKVAIAKCSAAEGCPWTHLSLDGGLQAGSSIVKASESDLHDLKKCGKHVLEHPIVWREDLEPVKGDGVALRIQRLFNLVYCARWVCVQWHLQAPTLMWAHCLLLRIQREIENLKTVIKEKGIKTSPALTNFLSSLSEDLLKNLKALISSVHIVSIQPSTELVGGILKELLQARLNAICALDNLYYSLYHYVILSPLAKDSKSAKSAENKDGTAPAKRKLEIPAPADYFKLFFDPVSQELSEMVSSFWKREVDKVTRKRMQKAYGKIEDALAAHESNPLFCIWYLKFVEYVRFVYDTGLSKLSKEMEQMLIASSGSKTQAKPSKKVASARLKSMRLAREKASEPLCGTDMQQWRDMARDWPSLLYAYAVPTTAALELISEYGPIVEMGAGTGYWAAQLKAFKPGLKVLAVDAVPPTLDGEQNEFHANSKSFTTVLKGNAKSLVKFSDHALFLCFPPPDDNMASDSLANYRGKLVIHVGEWEGFTGTPEFEATLVKDFDLIRTLDLPNWHDTCYNLTVWKRKTPALPSVPSSSSHSASNEQSSPFTTLLLPIHQCFNCKGYGKLLRRCKCCRIVALCSKKCAVACAYQHSSIHHLQGIFIQNTETTLQFENQQHFRLLRTSPFTGKQ